MSFKDEYEQIRGQKVMYVKIAQEMLKNYLSNDEMCSPSSFRE